MDEFEMMETVASDITSFDYDHNGFMMTCALCDLEKHGKRTWWNSHQFYLYQSRPSIYVMHRSRAQALTWEHYRFCHSEVLLLWKRMALQSYGQGAHIDISASEPVITKVGFRL